MGERISLALGVIGVFMIGAAFIAFPPAGIFFGAVFLWWAWKTTSEESRNRREQFEREQEEHRRLDEED